MLCLNEDSVWYGGPQSRSSPDTHKSLPLLRRLIREGKHEEAEKLVERAFMCSPWSQRNYEPLGNVMIDFGHAENDVQEYRRSLDLENAVSRVEYLWRDTISVSREVFASYPDDVIALKIQASEEIEFVVRLSRLGHIEYETNEFLDSIGVQDGNKLVMFATPGGHKSIRLCCALGIKTDGQGKVEAVGNHLIVKAKEALIVISARTTFRHSEDFDAQTLKDINAALENSANLWKRHVDDCQLLYNSMYIELGPPSPHDSHPTNERILDPPTPSLISLYHNYARYLLISSSRPAKHASLTPLDLPANLQGIWNPSFTSAWGSKFTININIQMNHFPTFTCNLASTALPLFSLLERVAENGIRTAKDVYGCRGWCCHSNTDIWADTDVADRWMPASLWPLGGVWLCLTIWEHYLFTSDTKTLRRMFPVMKGAVEFLLDFLVEDESREWLVTNPSLSPENTFIDTHGKEGRLCEGSAMDMSIIGALFSAFLDAATELREPSSSSVPEEQEPMITAVKEAQARLPPLKISEDTGRIQEWGHAYDYGEAEPGHRHTSHLFALYPGTTINPSQTPELAEAARRVLLHRAEHGGGHTGWSRAWLLLFWARLGDAGKVAEQIGLLMTKSTLPNLLDTHPPFQIDGNFGGAAGIVEALVQSHEIDEKGRRVVRLLPACPWSTGEVRDVGIRGGWAISFQWVDDKVVGKAKVCAVSGGSLQDGDEELQMTQKESQRPLLLVFPGVEEEISQVEIRGKAVCLVGPGDGTHTR